MPSTIKVRKSVSKKTDSTDINLLVSPESEDAFFEWDKSKIVNNLREEAKINKKEAEEIADAVEAKVLKSDIKIIGSSLLRELVDNELFERGRQKPLQRQKMIGLPKYDIEEMLLSKSNDNSNISSNNPEAVSFSLAETILKYFALQEVFSDKVSAAHKEGLIYLHDLGQIHRYYCSSHSLEMLKIHGLSGLKEQLSNLESYSSPAKHARTLTVQLNTFLASMQGYFAGALGIGYINILYAPYLVGLNDKEILQEAQHLIFQTSQNAFSRGGQCLFCDFNIHTGVPRYMRDIEAVGPGGEYTGKTYKEYEDLAMKFTKAILEITGGGDCFGTPMAFPKIDFHVSEDTLKDEKQRELLEYACEIASKNGSIYFVFDRDEVTLSACCRLRTTIDDDYMIKHPESMRFCGLQNVSVNLPQCAYRSGGDYKKFLRELNKTANICIKAHLEKREFVKQLAAAKGLPLYPVGRTAPDGRPYVDPSTATYIVGLVGLNECVQYLFGQELHESEETLWKGLEIISYLHLKVKENGAKHGMKFTLEESPAESASRRLAKMDVRNFPNDAIVRGDIEKDDIYYTNSIHMRPDAPIDLFTRITWQSKFHSLIESGAIIHAFVGESQIPASSIMNLVSKVFKDTECAQLTISPEFTICGVCGKTSNGLLRECPKCNSKDINVDFFRDKIKLGEWNLDEIKKLNG